MSIKACIVLVVIFALVLLCKRRFRIKWNKQCIYSVYELGKYLESQNRLLLRSRYGDVCYLNHDADICYILGWKTNHSALKDFFTRIYPTIKTSNRKIKLLTAHDDDTGVPGEIGRHDKMDYLKCLDDENVVAWFTVNKDMHHPKLHSIPLGVDFHTLSGKDFWGESRTGKDAQETQLNRYFEEAPNLCERHNKSISSFHFSIPERQSERWWTSDRMECKAALTQMKDHDFMRSRLSRSELWKLYRQYKFVICPHGNGIDCHRQYEAIALGCIPVVKTSTLDAMYRDHNMPVIIVNKWSDATIESLLVKMKSLTVNRETILNKYWADFIDRFDA